MSLHCLARIAACRAPSADVIFAVRHRRHSELRKKTRAGGAISMASAAIMVMIFLLETSFFVRGTPKHSITIDDHDNLSPTAGAFWVNFDVTFPSLTCDHISVDVEDRLGVRIFDIQKNVEKIPLDRGGAEAAIVSADHHYAARADHVSQQELDSVVANRDAMREEKESAKLDIDSFDDWARSHEWGLVTFGVDWCPWCQQLKPVWRSAATVLAARHSRTKLAEVDCTKHMNLCKKAGIVAFPTIRLFHFGKHVPPDYKGRRTVSDLVHFAETGSKSKEAAEKAGHKLGETHRSDVGCTVVGHLFVHKVPGRIQFSLKSDQHSFNNEHLNMTHQVHQLSFNDIPQSEEKMEAMLADHVLQAKVSKWLGQVFSSQTKHTIHEHYLKIVEYEYKHGFGRSNADHIYEHSISSHSYANSKEAPKVRFHFDLSPMQVTVENVSRPWYKFITMLCAFIGGTWSVMSLVNDVAAGGKIQFPGQDEAQ